MLVQLGLKEPEEEINKSERKNKLHRADIKTYYNRISYQNELLDAREILPTLQDEHILQLPWSPLQVYIYIYILYKYRETQRTK